MINFRGPAKRIEDLDLPRIGQMIGVGEDEIHAILDVEAGGSGFDSKGRPKMLFEPHVFYRNLSGDKRAKAVAQGLAHPNWRPGTYPSDSYPRLIAAMAIDETAALKSASWGLGQILGENYLAAGYVHVKDMVLEFTRDEDKHLEAMIRFIKKKGLDDELRRHDWAGFARGYNGALYASHGYHLKLSAAYHRWRKIKDTPFDPLKTPPDVPKPESVVKRTADQPVIVSPAPPPTSTAKSGGIAAGIAAAWAAITAAAQSPAVVIGGGVFVTLLLYLLYLLLTRKKA